MYPTRFPRNHWYVVARPDELEDVPMSRTILDTRIVLFRDEDGEPTALEDRCVHRSMPLSKGVLRAGRLQCRYHGITYDGTGAVVDIPCQTAVPNNRRAQRFPLHVGTQLIWIWMGEEDRADPALLPDHAWLDTDEWRTVGGRLHMNGRTQLLNENLTDLSHVSYLHAGSIGTEDVARAPIDVSVEGRTVTVRRPMPDVECPPFFTKVMGIHGRIARDSVAEFVAPSFHISHVAAQPLETAGAPKYRHRAVHCITPETETSAHYFWLIARDYRRDEPEVDHIWQDGAPLVFAEDVEAAEAIEAVLQSYAPDEPPEINVSADAGSLRARELVERLIADDQ